MIFCGLSMGMMVKLDKLDNELSNLNKDEFNRAKEEMFRIIVILRKQVNSHIRLKWMCLFSIGMCGVSGVIWFVRSNFYIGFMLVGLGVYNIFNYNRNVDCIEHGKKKLAEWEKTYKKYFGEGKVIKLR